MLGQCIVCINKARGRWAAGTGCHRLALLVVAGLAGTSLVAAVPDFAAAQQQYISGNYAACLEQAELAVADESQPEDWHILLGRGLMAVGRYAEARQALTNALPRFSRSIRLRWLAHEVFRANGLVAEAGQMIEEITFFTRMRPWAYREAADMVTFGRAALVAGADPKRVLDKLFQPAKQSSPDLRETYLAIGELALAKHDFALAAKTFQEGLKRLPEDPDLHCGLARAYAPSEPALMLASAFAALKRNSNHVASLLLLTDHRIDAEDYEAADQLLDRIEAINPWQPEAWAYRAVVAHLRNQTRQEQQARKNALKFWPTNPRVDQLIGLKLSQKYRFAEGAAHQRQALRLQPGYLPAQALLAQDLLRLGRETEGWRLADAVQQADPYDVTANNLMTLHDHMVKFRTLTNRHFAVRMKPLEATLYGARVLALLEQARERLCGKYGLTLTNPVLVEIFAKQSDFAVRTFGMPENHGFLGVCFGPVITANSPSSRPGQPFNWEAMLWHEFCHVVTLQLTRNKMPRWLSEGISVYEERQANPAWGEHLNPRYREMLLDQELTPVSQLSAAFLAPPSEVHLQFAYYQSSLVVEFLVQQYGFEKLIAILRDLGRGQDLNRTLEQRTAAMPELEKAFTAFAHRTANGLAPGLDWEKPDLETRLPEAASEAWTKWAATRPTNFWVLSRRAQQLVDEEQWAEAKTVLQTLVQLYPDATGADSAYRPLAAAHRALGETNAEYRVLNQYAEKDADAIDAYLRLMELAAAAQDWPVLAENARRYLAVNPMVPLPYRYLAEATERTGEADTAIEAYQALLALDPPNPVELHFKLGQLLYQQGDPAARRHVLQALEGAPRFRAALKLLLAMDHPKTTALQRAAKLTEDRP